MLPIMPAAAGAFRAGPVSMIAKTFSTQKDEKSSVKYIGHGYSRSISLSRNSVKQYFHYHVDFSRLIHSLSNPLHFPSRRQASWRHDTPPLREPPAAAHRGTHVGDRAG